MLRFQGMHFVFGIRGLGAKVVLDTFQACGFEVYRPTFEEPYVFISDHSLLLEI